MRQCRVRNCYGGEGSAFLEGDWERLYACCSQHRFSQTFDWCWANWEAIEKPQGRQVKSFVGQDEGRPFLIWPFVIYRRHLISVASPLGGAHDEYHDPLIEDGSEADQRLELAS